MSQRSVNGIILSPARLKSGCEPARSLHKTIKIAQIPKLMLE
jgi:hypothetical protein